jgi:hypothetical protein
MKKHCILVFLMFIVLCTSAQDYSSEQNILCSRIFSYLSEQGLSPNKTSDGMTFTKDGYKYYLEVDKQEKYPMFVRFSQYVNFNEKLTKTSASEKIEDYNNKFGVKVCILENSLKISCELFVANATQYNYVFDSFINQINSTYKEIIN